MTVRIAYNLFAQKAGEEKSDYERWVAMTEPGAGSDYLRMNGAGENLTWSAADFENFLEPRPDLAPAMERDLETIVARRAMASGRIVVAVDPPAGSGRNSVCGIVVAGGMENGGALVLADCSVEGGSPA